MNSIQEIIYRNHRENALDEVIERIEQERKRLRRARFGVPPGLTLPPDHINFEALRWFQRLVEEVRDGK